MYLFTRQTFQKSAMFEISTIQLVLHNLIRAFFHRLVISCNRFS